MENLNVEVNEKMIKDKISDQEVKLASEQIDKIVNNIEQVMIGKSEVVQLVVLALLSRGHVLIEDVPGVGKTSLVSALSKSIACSFKRIQFTPDTMPSDVTGFSIYNQKSGEFEFKSGAIMSNIILADEINRASAKTQASLLEAMEERQVTVDSITYQLKEPFIVLATQNPVESFGTYPLPEAQIDRFMLKLSIGYPEADEEMKVILKTDEVKKNLQPAVSSSDILSLQKAAQNIYVSEDVAKYIIQIITSTRNNPDLLLGSSPRGGIALIHLSRTYAMSKGRTYVLPDDVKYLAPFVLAHRVILSHEAKVAKKNSQEIINSILSNIIIPINVA